MGFLIDTNLWIAIERGTLSAADINAITRQQPVYVSPVNLAEMYMGLELIADSDLKRKAAGTIRRMKRKPFLRITAETAEIYGGLASKLVRRGKRGADFRVQDLWLAAQTVQRQFTLITSNARDFTDIPELKLVVLQ